MAADLADFAASGEMNPASHGLEVTPADTDLVLTEGFSFTRGIYIGVTGTLVVKFAGGEIVTFLNVAAGQVYPYRVSQIRAATTATGVVAIY